MGMVPEQQKSALVTEVAKAFEDKITKTFSKKLESFYLVGSYASGKHALERPDINYLLIFKGKASPDDFLAMADVLRKVVEQFKDKVLVRPEFRPFKCIYPKFRREYTILLNPIIMNMAEKDMPSPFAFPKWFTEGIKKSRTLIFGSDALAKVEIPSITRQDVREWMLRDILFQELPLQRAPVQYDEDEWDLFAGEVLTAEKNMATWGVEIAMSDEELAEKKYLHYVENKGEMIEFYKKRYGEHTAEMVRKILAARENYLKYQGNKEEVKEMFRIALNLADILKQKLFSG